MIFYYSTNFANFQGIIKRSLYFCGFFQKFNIALFAAIGKRCRSDFFSHFLTKISTKFRTGDQTAGEADLSLRGCSVRRFKIGEAQCNERRIGKTVAQQKISWRKLKAPPTAVCSLPSCLKRQRRLGRGQFVTKTKFSSRGLGGGSAGRYLIAQRQPRSLDENRPHFRTGGQRDCDSEMSCWTRLGVRLLVVFRSLPACSIDEWSHLWSEWQLGSVWMPLPLLREYVRCHIGMTVLIHRTSQFRMSVCSLCRTPLSYRKYPAHSHFDMIILTDFSLISFWFFVGTLLLIWPRHTFVLIWRWPKFSYRDDWTLVSKWPQPRIDMRGRKGDFLPSVTYQSESHFSCHLNRKIWRPYMSF